MTWLGAALVALLAILALRWPAAPRLLSAVQRLPAIAPALAALAAMVITWSAWGSLDPLPTVGDEVAYVLQAKLLARGTIAGDPPPVPEFFEQAHVLVTPRLAPKYPIGFGLALVPGVLVGATALVPLLLAGITAALLFSLCRRFYGGATATLACAIWFAAPGGRYRAGFFSETLTGATCLLAWYGLVRWREGRALRWLLLVSLSFAVAAITRPLTALVLAIPVAVVVLRDVARLRLWRQAVLSLVTALPVIGLLPLQNVATGGPWWELPYGRYTREYLPFDHMGLGLDDRAPTRTRPPDIERLAQAFATFHKDYTVARVPAALVARTRVFFADLAGNAALLAFVLALAGVVAGPGAVRFAAGSAVALFVVHLAYAHPPQWSIYYAEALPVGAATVAVGATALATLLARRFSPGEPAQRAALLTTLAAVIAIWPLQERVAETRLNLEVAREPLVGFEAATAAIHEPAVVFVRYALGHRMHRSLIRNPDDYATALIWTAYDRGDDNARLMAVAGNRAAYIYDERWMRLERPDGSIVAVVAPPP
jgi:4-amino-4-deoxy-L-arabinose transferase-like glycosyltransferase